MRKSFLAFFAILCLIATGAMAVETMDAAYLTITVDGDAADWDMTASQPIHMVNPNPIDAAHPLTVDMRCAWDDTYLYFLLQETDNSAQQEAATADAFTTDGPWYYDCISPWIDLKGTNNGQYGFNPWFGFSSTGIADMWGARVNNNDAGGFVPAVLANGNCATSGTFAGQNRTIEARVMWTDLGASVDAAFLPDGGLAAAITAGMTIGMDPLMVENDFHHQSFLNGIVGTPPSGADEFSYDIVLTAPAAPPVVHASGNIYTNAGFDDGPEFAIDTPASDYTNDQDIPGWRIVSVSGATGHFGAVAEATAPSAPNVLEIGRATGGGFRLDRWSTSVAIVSGATYKQSFWVRKITGEAGTLNIHPFAMTGQGTDPWHENVVWDYNVTGLTQGVWEKHESFLNFPAGAGFSCPYITPMDVGPTYQIDDFMLEDAALLDLCPNGRFENADRLIGWKTDLAATIARGMVGTIVTDAANVAEGSKALSMVKTSPEVEGDALFRSYDIPWVTGHEAYLAFSVKNDPTIGADSHVLVFLTSESDTAVAYPVTYLAGGAADGSYKRYEMEVPIDLADANKLYIDLRVRKWAEGEDWGTEDTAEAAFIDFISLGDLTAGGVPVEMSSFEIQ